MPRIKLELCNMPKAPYVHVWDSKRIDGGCLFYNDDLKPRSWVRSLFKVRQGKRTAMTSHTIHVSFGRYDTIFRRCDKDGNYI